MRIVKFLNKHLEEYLILIFFSAMTLLILCQIVFRYVFSMPLAWTEELARYIFIWLIYIGASYAIVLNKHLKVEIILVLLNDKKKRYLSLLSNFFFMIFSVIIVYYGVLMVYTMLFVRKQNSPVLKIPMGIIYSAVPFCAFLMLIRIIQHSILLIKKGKKAEQ
ncbi:Sialic acid TRAP transporter permease protein SiaT [bioreactor metagenome]|uniref:Sialic acid TRAP transporter permease protein SiaT n=1 Tax=bioreactor metagenome TaxID=1076179 RepID=A0A645GMM8_9ZZZZ